MVRNGGQSIAKSANVYTIYNSIKMDDFPTDEHVELDIRYKDWNVETRIEKAVGISSRGITRAITRRSTHFFQSKKK
ncbi:hypothetical protein OL548_27910 [Lysinibacillus sp. MHQ-1]|nr:hypothetical protein OL548_27910 [Lysinibacillus sp. MHQ-1]